MKSQSINWKYLLTEAGLLLLFSYLFLFTGYNDVFYSMPVLWVVAVLVTVLGVVIILTKRPRCIPLSLPILIFFIICFVTTIFSADPRRSVDQIYFYTLTLFVFIASIYLVRTGIKEELISKTILIAGFLATFVLFLNAAFWYIGWLRVMPGTIIPTIPYRLPSGNVAVIFFNPLLFLILSSIFSSRSRIWKIVLILFALFVTFMIFLTSSRGGWLGTAVGLLCLLLLSGKAGWIKWKKVFAWLKDHRILVVIGLAILICMIAGLLFLLVRQSAHPTHRPVSEARMEFWPPAIKTFLKHPVFGQGLLTFSISMLQSQSVPPFKIFVHAHSVPFNILAEMGLVGMVALVFLVVSIGYLFWKRFFRNKIEEPTIPMAAIAAFMAIVAEGLFDCYNNKSFGFWLVVILVGCTLAKPIPDKSRPYHRQYWLLIFIPVVWVHLFLMGIYNSGVSAVDEQDNVLATTQYERAVKYDPYSAISHQQLGLMYSFNLQHIDDAIKEYETTIALDPDWALNYANLGALYARAGDLQKGVEFMQMAIDKAPDCALFHLNMGYLQEQAGDFDRAASEFKTYLNSMPEFSDSAFWTTNTFRNDTLLDWRSEQIPISLSLTQARQFVQENPNDQSGYINAARLEMEAGEFINAERYLSLATLVYTTRPWQLMDVYWMHAEIEASKGDYEGAIKLAENALEYYRYQDVGGPGNMHGILYVNFVFRRPAMQTVLVPYLLKNPLPSAYETYMEDLVGWYQSIGDTESGERIQAEILQFTEDYTVESQP